ncbi:MAG: hypothetical protein ACOYM9_22770, partial [Bradymonadia bacterium]
MPPLADPQALEVEGPEAQASQREHRVAHGVEHALDEVVAPLGDREFDPSDGLAARAVGVGLDPARMGGDGEAVLEFQALLEELEGLWARASPHLRSV